MIWLWIKITHIAACAVFTIAGIVALKKSSKRALFLVWLGLGLQTLFLVARPLALENINVFALDTMFLLPWSLAVITVTVGLLISDEEAATLLAVLTALFAIATLPFPRGVIPPTPK